MNTIANSSVVMNAIANSSTIMNAIANSSVAMNAIINSYIAINTMTTLTVYNAIATSPVASSAVSELLSKINSGSMVFGGGKTGDSSHIGLNGFLTLLSANNGYAIQSQIPSNYNVYKDLSSLSIALDNAFSSLEQTLSVNTADTGTVYANNTAYTNPYSGSSIYVTPYNLSKNQIVYVIYVIAAGPYQSANFFGATSRLELPGYGITYGNRTTINVKVYPGNNDQ